MNVKSLRSRLLLSTSVLLAASIVATLAWVGFQGNRLVSDRLASDLTRAAQLIDTAQAERYASLRITAELLAAFPELNALSKQGRWTEMGDLVSDEILETFAVRCTPDELPSRLGTRYAGLVDRLSLVCHSTPQKTDPERWAHVIARLRAL